jgi:hypothetical protein
VEFLGAVSKRGWGTYLVDMAGGQPRLIMAGYYSSAWSFDDKALLVNIPTPGKNFTDVDSMQLAAFDIESGKISVIPKSRGKGGPFQPTPQMIRGEG